MHKLVIAAAFGLVALAIATAMAVAMAPPTPKPTPIYQFEVMDRGDVYVVDYGLTEQDCEDRRRANPEGFCREVRHGYPGRS